MKRPFLALFLFWFGLSNTFATENRMAGARSIGLSNAFVSVSDTWSTFHNQATLAALESFSAGVFYESRFMIDELSSVAGSLVLPVNTGTFGVSIFQFGQGTYKENKIGISFSKKLFSRLNAGVQLDYFTQQFPENDGANGFATFECGISYLATDYLTLGAHIFNPVQNGFDTLEGKQKMPLVIRLGGHYQFSDMVLITMETQKEILNPFMVKSGIEFSPVKNLALRFGISGRPVQYTAGIGYSIKRVITNIGFSYHGNLGITPSVSIQFNL